MSRIPEGPREYPTPPEVGGGKGNPDDVARASRVRAHHEGWRSGFAEGAIWMFSQLLEQAAKTKRWSAEIEVAELRRRFGDEMVERELGSHQLSREIGKNVYGDEEE